MSQAIKVHSGNLQLQYDDDAHPLEGQFNQNIFRISRDCFVS